MQGDSPADPYGKTFDAPALEDLLTSRGVHPDDVVTLLRYAPLGLTSMCWRNTVLETWHAGRDSRIGDADMMRATVATTRLFHQALWFAFDERLADGSLVSRGDFDDVEDLEGLAVAFADVLEEAFAADRELPHGLTLSDIGGDEVSELHEHAEHQLEALLEQAELHGVAVVLMWLAAKGRLACAAWWSAPGWPFIVDALVARVGDRNDPFWVEHGWKEQPVELQDLTRFRHLLLSAPDVLRTETLEYCLSTAGLRHIHVD